MIRQTMDKEKRFIMKIVYIPLLLLIVLLTTGCGIDKNKEYQMKPFTFTDQNGEPFGTQYLKGKVWIADFIFTSCETVCPPMTASMSALQEEMKKKGIEVEFVSFSTDPEIDTPAKLKEFSEKFGDNGGNWHLLTGYKQSEIETFAREEFQTLIQKPESSDQVIHSTSFYVIDQYGRITNSFGFQKSHFDEIVREVEKLQ
ncbi:SCO family protein [Bacillus sp. Marseille-Q1617]|uniref:SCO family protein n=1 Tax=Bacillus sp. Marseille-Q1617 TaxID=2736887 RepID=UPI0020CA8457|nr:SCO family protein [Bacillus sp. Marseille-Q1617]